MSDVAAQALTAKGEVTVTEPTRIETATARRVAESAATIPTGTVEVAVSLPAGPVPAVVLPALGRALAEHPRANGAWRDGRLERYSRANVAVVLATPAGLVAPTLFDADRHTTAELERELAGLADAARDERLTSPQLSGATATLWVASGVDRGTAPVTPGQAVALVLAVGEGGATLTLSFDQRVLGVGEAARFLARVAALLEGREAAYEMSDG